MGYSERLEIHSISSSAAGIERLRPTKNLLKKLSQLSLLMTLVISSGFSAAVTPTGRTKMQLTTEQKEELKDTVTQPSFESTAYSNYDLTATVTDLVRSKKHTGISEERLAEDTRETACKKSLWDPQTDTEDLLIAADAHRDLVDEYCAEDVIPDCRPVPTLLHISRMCDRTPAAIQNHEQLKTVVMRCPTLPCCKVTHSCTTKTSVEFNITFKTRWGGTRKILTIPVRNDTECDCREGPTKCPKPFRTTRDGCTCHQKSKTAQIKCEQIESGLQNLTASERRCVEENKCRVPRCSSNLKYDAQKGRCVSACTSL